MPKNTCAVEDCETEATSRGLCKIHYARWWRAEQKVSGRRCAVEGCESVATARGWCDMHYRRFRVDGDPGEATKRKRPNGWNGGLTRDGYRILWVAEEKRRVAEHVFVMEQSIGRRLEPGENVHHINGVKHDNRIENLELWFRGQPVGQRVTDLVQFIVDNYRPLVEEALNAQETRRD